VATNTLDDEGINRKVILALKEEDYNSLDKIRNKELRGLSWQAFIEDGNGEMIDLEIIDYLTWVGR
jgi:hypothetical protein|tara:strand:- start:52 stop:249 length:198 start_codon:yes stop_codon:yes gene_type:complete